MINNVEMSANAKKFEERRMDFRNAEQRFRIVQGGLLSNASCKSEKFEKSYYFEPGLYYGTLDLISCEKCSNFRRFFCGHYKA